MVSEFAMSWKSRANNVANSVNTFYISGKSDLEMM